MTKLTFVSGTILDETRFEDHSEAFVRVVGGEFDGQEASLSAWKYDDGTAQYEIHVGHPRNRNGWAVVKYPDGVIDGNHSLGEAVVDFNDGSEVDEPMTIGEVGRMFDQITAWLKDSLPNMDQNEFGVLDHLLHDKCCEMLEAAQIDGLGGCRLCCR